MIVSKMIPCPNFWVCMGTASANQVIPHENTKLGHYNDCMYILEGNASVSNGINTVQLNKGNLADLSILKDTDTNFTINDQATTWVAFNPKRLDRDLDVSIHNSNNTIYGPCVLYSIDGDIKVNDKVVKSEQFVRVPNNTTVQVEATNLYAEVK